MHTSTLLRHGGQSLWTSRRGSGPRLVLLHGGPGLDGNVVAPLADVLAARFEVWTPDLPGHGRSHEDGARMPDLRTLYDRTSRWLAGAGPEVLVGHSLGAWLAREAIRRGRVHPGATVWISPPAGSGPGRRSAVRNRAEATGAFAPGEESDEAVRREFLRYAAGETTGPLSARFLAAAGRCRMRPPWAYAGLLRQLHRALLRTTPTCRPACPTLVLCGGRDRTTPPDHARAVVAATPGAVLRVVPDEGHLPGSGATDGIARAAVAWLGELGLSPSGGG